jgi:hypothetical protein
VAECGRRSVTVEGGSPRHRGPQEASKGCRWIPTQFRYLIQWCYDSDGIKRRLFGASSSSRIGTATFQGRDVYFHSTTTTPFTTMRASFPALYLYPLNADSFVKHINLTNNRRVKIGRQAIGVPAMNNGYFDSAEVSRLHAEVWEEGGKVCIRSLPLFSSCPDRSMCRSSSKT